VAAHYSIRRQKVISGWLLLLLMAIVIHPLFDIPHSRVTPGFHAVQLSLPVVGYTSNQLELTIGVHYTSLRALRPAAIFETFSPLLC
jgi:hypothetical protein